MIYVVLLWALKQTLRALAYFTKSWMEPKP